MCTAKHYVNFRTNVCKLVFKDYSQLHVVKVALYFLFYFITERGTRVCSDTVTISKTEIVTTQAECERGRGSCIYTH